MKTSSPGGEPARPIRTLILDDSKEDADLTLWELQRAGFAPDFRRVDSADGLLAALADGEWDIILADYAMPGFTGLVALEMVRSKGMDIPFIIVSGTIGEEIAVAAMKAGAHDYLMKGNLSRLSPVVNRELQEYGLRKQHRQAQEELKKGEEKLRQSQKLEAVGRLAGGISHDFNNLLTVIGGYTDMTMAGMKPSDPYWANLGQIKDAVVRAAFLTRQLLAFSRKQVITPKVIDLNSAVKDMYLMLKPLIREDIRLTISPAGNLDKVKGDIGQIQQIIMNLVLNARDAMPEGGDLILSTGNVRLDGRTGVVRPGLEPGPYVMLAVTDTGIGMDEATLSQIFEPFFTTKEVGQGTGLGLSTVYGIVNRSGGQINVSSRPGAGTTFEVYLPASQEEEKAPAVKTGSDDVPFVTGVLNIILVEDSEPLSALVREILFSKGYRVTVCKNGQDAMRAATSVEPVHLLLTDLIMPGIGGVELAHTLLSRHPETAVLFMSGYTEGPALPQQICGRSPNFLPKPFGPDQLLRKVGEILAAPAGIASVSP